MVAQSGASQGSWTSPHGRPLPQPGPRTLVMGILNVTPDSFSDGGALPDVQAVVARARAMAAAGADILDIGGESTRPGAAPVSPDEEARRVVPAVEAVRAALPDLPLSIDTTKPAVARLAVRAGADIVNDVWGLTLGLAAPERAAWVRALREGRGARSGTIPTPPPDRGGMAAAVGELGCPVILMHNRPDRAYGDFWEDVLDDLRLSLALAHAAGVPERQAWVDPGFGFAKDPAHNLEVVRGLSRLLELGRPVLLGTSRKSTLGLVIGAPVDDRVDATAATVTWGIQQGCSMVRLHDVDVLVRTVRMADALRAGLDWSPPSP